jgi:hypothetical protein
MADFVRLPEMGIVINLDTVKKYYPNRSKRLDYTDGTHDQLTDADAEVLTKSLFPGDAPKAVPVKQVGADEPRRRGRPRKKVTT